MKINKEVIKGFNACESGYQNFITKYPNFNGSFLEILELENVPYRDKIWLARRVLNKNQLVHFGLLCAESVLNIFEDEYPLDKRVQDCFSYIKQIPDFSMITDIQRKEIYRLRSGVLESRSTAYARYVSDAMSATHATYATSAAAYASDAATSAASDADADASATYATSAASDASDAVAAYAVAATYAASDAADAVAAVAAYAAYAASDVAASNRMTRDEARAAQYKLNLEFLKMAASL